MTEQRKRIIPRSACVPICTVPGCGRPPRYPSMRPPLLCRMHYFRTYRGQPPGEPESRRTRYATKGCDVPGCDKPHSRHGLCMMHATRWERHGDPNVTFKPFPRYGPDNTSWIGDDAGYYTVHRRIQKQYGSASEYVCECGKTARHWAYQHDDPDERTAPEGPYSIDPDRYLPMCVPCHKRLDLGRAKVVPPVSP